MLRPASELRAGPTEPLSGVRAEAAGGLGSTIIRSGAGAVGLDSGFASDAATSFFFAGVDLVGFLGLVTLVVDRVGGTWSLSLAGGAGMIATLTPSERHRPAAIRPYQRRLSYARPTSRSTIVRSSVISCMAYRTPSRPTPDSFTPPYGITSTRIVGTSFTITAPTSSTFHARCA